MTRKASEGFISVPDLTIVMYSIKRILQGKSTSTTTAPSSTSPDAVLQCGEDFVAAIAFISCENLISIASADGTVRIYSRDTDGQPVRLFRKHKRHINGLVHLCGAVVASVDASTRIITWRVDTCEVLQDLQLSHHGCISMKKVAPNELLVALENGEILRVTYAAGRDLSVAPTVTSCGAMSGIAAHADGLVTVWNVSKKVHIWNTLSGERKFSFFDERIPNCVAMNEKYIVTGSDGGRIYVRENCADYRALPTINIYSNTNLNQSSSATATGIISDLDFISAHIIMATTTTSGIFFLSLASGERVGHFIPSSKKRDKIRVAAMGADGRICVGGKGGYCAIFRTPSQLEQHTNIYTENMRAQSPLKEQSYTADIAYDADDADVKSEYDAVQIGHIGKLLDTIGAQQKLQEARIVEIQTKMDVMDELLRDQIEEIELVKRKMKKIDGLFTC